MSSPRALPGEASRCQPSLSSHCSSTLRQKGQFSHWEHVGIQWGPPLHFPSLGPGLLGVGLLTLRRAKVFRGKWEAWGSPHGPFQESQAVRRDTPEPTGRGAAPLWTGGGCWCPLASRPAHWPPSAGGMYHGDLTEKLKALYKLHLPPGESLPPAHQQGPLGCGVGAAASQGLCEVLGLHTWAAWGLHILTEGGSWSPGAEA